MASRSRSNSRESVVQAQDPSPGAKTSKTSGSSKGSRGSGGAKTSKTSGSSKGSRGSGGSMGSRGSGSSMGSRTSVSSKGSRGSGGVTSKRRSSVSRRKLRSASRTRPTKKKSLYDLKDDDEKLNFILSLPEFDGVSEILEKTKTANSSYQEKLKGARTDVDIIKGPPINILSGTKKHKTVKREEESYNSKLRGSKETLEGYYNELKKIEKNIKLIYEKDVSKIDTKLKLKLNKNFMSLLTKFDNLKMSNASGDQIDNVQELKDIKSDIEEIKIFVSSKSERIDELQDLIKTARNAIPTKPTLSTKGKGKGKGKVTQNDDEKEISEYNSYFDSFKELTINNFISKIINYDTSKLEEFITRVEREEKGNKVEGYLITVKGSNGSIEAIMEVYNEKLGTLEGLDPKDKSKEQLERLEANVDRLASELNLSIDSIKKEISASNVSFNSSNELLKGEYKNETESDVYKTLQEVVKVYSSFFKKLKVVKSKKELEAKPENLDSYIENAKNYIKEKKKKIETAISQRETELATQEAAKKSIEADLGKVTSDLENINSKEEDFNKEYIDYTAKLNELNDIKETQMKKAKTKGEVKSLNSRATELSREINASIKKLNGFVKDAEKLDDSAQGIEKGIDNKASGLKGKELKDVKEIKSQADEVNTVFKRINGTKINSEKDISKIVSEIESVAKGKIREFDEAARKEKERKAREAAEKARKKEEKAKKEEARKAREAAEEARKEEERKTKEAEEKAKREAAMAEEERKRREKEDKERLRTLPKLIPTLKKNIGGIFERYNNNKINNEKVKKIVEENLEEYKKFEDFPDGKSSYNVSELREIERIAKKVENDYENVIGIGRIFVKFFPIGAKENPRTKFITSKNNDITIHSENCNKLPTPEIERGPFTKVFTTKNNNTDVFNEISSVIKGMKSNDYNFAFMALGQSGSGKTFTITGGEDEDGNKVDGVLQEAIEEVKKTKPKKIFISSIQIYKGKAYDALVDKESSFLNRKDINVIKSVQDEDGIYQVDATTKFDYIESQKQISGIDIDSAMTSKDVNDVFKKIQRNIIYEEGSNKNALDEYIEKIQKNRPTRQTLLNDDSSRSHLYIIFTIEYPGNKERILSFIDLAGNEVPYKMPDNSEAEEEGKQILNGIDTLNIILKRYSAGLTVPKDKYYPNTGKGIGETARGTIKDFSSWNVLNGIIGFFKGENHKKEESFSKLILLLTLHPTVPDTSLINKKKLTELTQKELKAIELKNQICGTTRTTLLFGEQVLGIKRTQGGTSKLKAKKISLKRNSKTSNKSSIKKKSPKKKKVSQKRKTPKKKVIKKKL